MIILLYVCYAKFIRKDPVIKIGKYGILIVLTNSMEPIIKENELIMIKENSKYQLNDIVTYVDLHDTLITHRIIQMDKNDFIAKGDNNSVADEGVTIDNIQGKVMYHSKVLGIFILYYLKIIIIAYFILLIILCLINQSTKEDEQNEAEEE